MTIGNIIGKNKIFAGFTWGEAIRHASNPKESDTWITKILKWDKSKESFYDWSTTFSHYELKTYGVYYKDRSVRVPKTLNNYVEQRIKENNIEIKDFHNIYINK
jgi:hypothetical protein